MDPRAVWPRAGEALQAVGARYQPALARAAAEAGLGGPEPALLFAALTFEPARVSAERLQVRTPYSAAAWFDRRLADLAAKGFLEPTGDREYRLTERGHQAARRMLDAAFARMAELQPLPAADLARLAALLARLSEACLAAPDPPGTRCVGPAHRLAPGPGASLVAQIDRSLSDLAAFRDDAHLAAWRPHGFDGPAWEALTFVWRGEAASADELAARLEPRRGHGSAVYARALADLARRGLVESDDGGSRVTDAGRRLRAAADELTDRYFFAAWSCLDDAEVDELHGLLARFRDGLATSSA